MAHTAPQEPAPGGPETRDGTPEPEIARSQERAVQEGRQTGYEDGFAEGLRAGREAAAEELRRALAALERLREQIEAPLISAEKRLADILTEGALHLARHVIRAELSADPGKISAVVREVLEEAAAARTAGQSLSMRVNPADLSRVEPIADEIGVDLEGDPEIERGGARVTLADSDANTVHRIEWDARLDTRWSAIEASLMPPGE